MFGNSLICATTLVEAVLNVLGIIGLIAVGAFIIVFVCDVFLSLLGNKNGIFFKAKKDESTQTKVQEYEYIQDRVVENKQENNNQLYTNIDFDKARQEEEELNQKLAYNENGLSQEVNEVNNINTEENTFTDLNDLLFGEDEKDVETNQEDLDNFFSTITEEKESEQEVVEENNTNENEIEIEDDEYQDIIDAINKMREEEEQNLPEKEQAIELEESIEEENNELEQEEDVDSLISLDILNDAENLVVEDTTVESEQIAEETKEEISKVRDDEYYKALSDEIAELKKELEEQRLLLEKERQEVVEKNALLEQEKNELLEKLEEAKAEKEQVEEVVTVSLLTEQDCLDRLAVLQERLKENEKLLRKAKREFKPLERVKKTLERDKAKLRRKDAIVAKQKIVLYGVNNYIDIDEGRAAKLAEDLDLLDGLKLSVQHCEEVMSANADRYPILEQTYKILSDANVQIKEDIALVEKDLEAIRNNVKTTDNIEEIVSEEPVVENVAEEVVANDNDAIVSKEAEIEETSEQEDVKVEQETDEVGNNIVNEEIEENVEPINNVEDVQIEEVKEDTLEENISQDINATEEEIIEDTVENEEQVLVEDIQEDNVQNDSEEEQVQDEIEEKVLEESVQNENAEQVEQIEETKEDEQKEEIVEPVEDKAEEETKNEEIQEIVENDAEEEKKADTDEDDDDDNGKKKDEPINKYVQKIKNPKPSKKDAIKEENEDSEITPELQALLRRTKFSLNDLISDDEDND